MSCMSRLILSLCIWITSIITTGWREFSRRKKTQAKGKFPKNLSRPRHANVCAICGPWWTLKYSKHLLLNSTDQCLTDSKGQTTRTVMALNSFTALQIVLCVRFIVIQSSRLGKPLFRDIVFLNFREKWSPQAVWCCLLVGSYIYKKYSLSTLKNSSPILSLLAKKEKWASSKKQNSVWNLKFSIWTECKRKWCMSRKCKFIIVNIS